MIKLPKEILFVFLTFLVNFLKCFEVLPCIVGSVLKKNGHRLFH